MAVRKREKERAEERRRCTYAIAIANVIAATVSKRVSDVAIVRVSSRRWCMRTVVVVRIRAACGSQHSAFRLLHLPPAAVAVAVGVNAEGAAAAAVIACV